jgi:hypothetical protein
MSRPRNIGVLILDPTVLTGIGRGDVSSGTPTLISKTVTPAFPGDVSVLVVVTGSLNGTLTVECCNSTDTELTQGVDRWTTYTLTIPAVAGAAIFGLRLPRYEFGRLRLKFVTSSGTGSILAQLAVKGE